jgi:hypothetical protein
MRTARWISIVLLLLGLAPASAPAELGECEPSPSDVIFPRQSIPLYFSHEQHLAQKLPCDMCHEAAPDSTSASESLIPTEETCTTCHEIDRAQPDKQVAAGQPDAKCSSCHPGWNGQGEPARVVIPRPNLKFNHKVHVDRKIRCIDCHGDLLARKVGLATRAELPRMTLCFDCHEKSKSRSATKCTTCHLGEAGGRMKTDLPEGKLVPSGVLRGDAHDLRFRTEHARIAKTDEAYCGSCHEKEFCVDCHDGVVKPLDFHGNDYVTLHPIDARRNNPDCSACHRAQTFCTGCHGRVGVGDDPKTSQFERPSVIGGARNLFHPRTPRGDGTDSWTADHHATQGRRNIKACASCHREEFCMSCHAGAGAIDPHGPSFASSSRCEALRSRSERMCMRCHVMEVPPCE